MEDKEKIKAIIGIVNHIKIDNSLGYQRLVVDLPYTKYMCDIFNVKFNKKFYSGFTSNLDERLSKIIEKYKDLFELYDISHDNLSYPTYKDQAILWSGK